jgi:hypothetical protein
MRKSQSQDIMEGNEDNYFSYDEVQYSQKLSSIIVHNQKIK